MKIKALSLIVLALYLIQSACSPTTIVSTSGEQPTPIIESDSSTTGYQPLSVDQLDVQVGEGSPIPVHAIMSGSLPDTCAQIEYAEQEQDGSNFIFTLSTIPSSAEGCVQDPLPFRITLPLNVANLPAGIYSVEVNGSQATFELDTANTTSSLPTTDSAVTRNDVQVDGVYIEIGTGSPIPVHAIVSLNLPNTCAQLGEIRVNRDGTTFYVRLIAYIAERADCKTDSIPFRAEIPLNIVNLPEGPYEVNVNGVGVSFDQRAVPTNQPTSAPGQPAGSRFLFEGVGFFMDSSVVDSASGQIVPENPGSQEGPWWDINPQYVSISFDDYPLTQTYFKPVIAVYPVEDYRRLSPQAAERLDNLKDFIIKKPNDANQIPFLPMMNSGQVFHSNLMNLDFQNGSGVRFLATYSQGLDPITNRDLVYTYQGLTADERYAVSVFLPVNHPSLPADPNTLSPDEVDTIYKDYEKYRTDMVDMLTAQPASSFIPDLEKLDAMIESITID